MRLWRWIKRIFKKPQGGGTIPSKPSVGRSDGYYKKLWDTMEILEEKKSTVQWYVNKATSGKERYNLASEYVLKETGKNIPWQVIAVLHAMEASFNFDKQILNGESWTLPKTQLIPRGLGPFSSWNDACVTAFKHPRWDNVDFNDVEEVGNVMERYNGLGYMRRGENSPYLFSFSNHGLKTGKFTSDGVYNPWAISKQCGCFVLLKELGMRFKHER